MSTWPTTLSCLAPYRGSGWSWQWPHLDPSQVATSLDRIIERPDLLDQGEFGCCGEVAFLRAWLLRDPDAVAAFACDLLLDGKAQIGTNGYWVQPSSGLLASDYVELNPGLALTSVGWMLAGSLADREDDFVAKFTGTPDQESSLGTTAQEVAGWLAESGLYYSVDHNLCAFNNTTGDTLTVLVDVLTGLPLPNFSDSQTISDALKLDPTPGPWPAYQQTDILLAINANMFLGLLPDSPSTPVPRPVSGIQTLYSNHWVVLEDKIKVLGPAKYSIKLWCWGQRWEIYVSGAVFNANYFGAIRGHALGPQRLEASVHSTQTIVPLAPERWDVWYDASGNQLHASWQAAEGTDRWCTVLDASGTAVLDCWGGVGDRSQGYVSDNIGWYDRYQLHDVLVAGNPGDPIHPFVPDWPDRFARPYRVCARNFLVGTDVVTPNCAESTAVQPLDRAETSLYRISFYGYARTPVADQIPDPQAFNDVTVKLASGGTLGEMTMQTEVNGSQEVIFGRVFDGAGSTVPLYMSCPRAPDYVARIAVSLHYCHRRLEQAPLRLFPANAATMPPADIWSSSQLSRVFVCKAIPSDADAGPSPIRLDPNLPSDDAIALAAANAVIDQAEDFVGVKHGDALLDAPARLLLQDATLGLDGFMAVLRSFGPQVGRGVTTPAGAAAYWAYVANQHSTPSDARGLAAIGDVWTRRYFTNTPSDEYRNFVLALGSCLLTKVPSDLRYNFGAYQSAISNLSTTSGTVSATAAAAFSGNLQSLAYHVLTIDPAVPNVRVHLTSGQAACLRMMLLDAQDNLLDVIETNVSPYDRVVGLRGGTIRKIVFALANGSLTTSSGAYKVTASAEMSAADVDVSGVWLTCADPSVKDIAGQSTNVIDVVNFAAATAHMTLRNRGNAPADMRVRLSATLTHPDSAAPQQIKFSGASPDFIAVTVPAPLAGKPDATIEVTAGFDPHQLGLKQQPKAGHIQIQYMAFNATAENTPGATQTDGSPDNNSAGAFVDTNASGFTGLGGQLHVGLVLTQPFQDVRQWRISAIYDGVDLIAHARDLGTPVVATVEPSKAAPGAKNRAQRISFAVNTDALQKVRSAGSTLKSRYAPVARVEVAQESPFAPWQKAPSAATAGSMTFTVIGDGQVLGSTSVRVPLPVKRVIPHD
jgi:hypothetical protein